MICHKTGGVKQENISLIKRVYSINTLNKEVFPFLRGQLSSKTGAPIILLLRKLPNHLYAG